ncbi:MAG: hypothetical protein ACK5H1_08920 [Tenacibaculum sp.]
MLFVQKIKASALQYVLVVSVLISIIVFTFIYLIFLQQKLQIKHSFFIEAIQNVHFGFDYLSRNKILYNQIKEKQFSENPYEKTTLLKQYWGAFTIAVVSSTVKNENFKKIGLLANKPEQRRALYLRENNKPLVLVGNTKITGNAQLPKQGAKRGNIAGISYNRNRLIYGSQQLSNTYLPVIENIELIKDMFQQSFLNDSVAYFNLEDKLRKTQKFTQTTAIYQSNKNIYLKNVFLQGKIIIQSGKSITVAPSAKLEDVILIAPKVEILGNTVGSFQVFASKKISLAKKCQLNYPSALILIDKASNSQSSSETANIFIGENTKVKGLIIYKNESEESDFNFNPQLFISKDATVTGEVYCNRNLELSGNINGSVFTSNFITKQFGSVYVNHIYNGTINSEQLPEQYLGLAINTKTEKVAKWLY